MTVRVAVPSGGRLRDGVLGLLQHAGYPTGAFRGATTRANIEGLEFLEMRPRDAGAWLAAGRVEAAFVSSDIVLEEELEDRPALPLGLARSDLVIASREDDGRTEAADLAGGVVATHLPRSTRRWFRQKDIDVTVVAMGGALEGVCAAGLADGIADLRETGTSLQQNGLRVLAEIASCQAVFVHSPCPALDDLVLRLGAAIDARRHRYVMLHLPPGQVEELGRLFPGLASPTVLPLAGRQDIVDVHLVADVESIWSSLGELRAVGATGIVAIEPDGLLR